MKPQQNTLLVVEHLRKLYSTRFGGNQVEALKDISFSIERGEFIAVMGESGSGKTTLLNILAALDRPTEGMVLLDNQDITKIRDSNISKFRRENLGFVFQDFNLLDNFSLRDNIYLPLVLSDTPKKKMDALDGAIGGSTRYHRCLRKISLRGFGWAKAESSDCTRLNHQS